jgi:hypothetical protein
MEAGDEMEGMAGMEWRYIIGIVIGGAVGFGIGYAARGGG